MDYSRRLIEAEFNTEYNLVSLIKPRTYQLNFIRGLINEKIVFTIHF
jgi:hypothetical protein